MILTGGQGSQGETGHGWVADEKVKGPYEHLQLYFVWLFFFSVSLKNVKAVGPLLCYQQEEKSSIITFFALDTFQVSDEKSIQRRINLTTFPKKMKQMMYLGFIPLKLSTSWDHVNINLAKVTNELFGAKYVETVKIKVSFCRLQLRVHVHTHSPYRLISTLFLSDSSKLSNTEGVFH